MMKLIFKKTVLAGWSCPIIVLIALPANSDVVVGGTGSSCAEDPACINRLPRPAHQCSE